MSQVSSTGQKWVVLNKKALGPTTAEFRLRYFPQFLFLHENQINRYTYNDYKIGNYTVTDGKRVVGYIINGTAKPIYNIY